MEKRSLAQSPCLGCFLKWCPVKKWPSRGSWRLLSPRALSVRRGKGEGKEILLSNINTLHEEIKTSLFQKEVVMDDKSIKFSFIYRQPQLPRPQHTFIHSVSVESSFQRS